MRGSRTPVYWPRTPAVDRFTPARTSLDEVMAVRSGPVQLAHLVQRRRLRQHRWRLLTAAVTLIVVGATLAAVRSAESARAAWTDQVLVTTTTRDLAPGEILSSDDLKEVSLPAAAVPSGASPRSVTELVGQLVRVPMVAGEVVVSARLGNEGLSPAAARLPPASRAVAIALGEARPPLQPGDRVDLVAAGARSATTSRTVARLVEVLDVGDQTVTVIVPVAQVPEVVVAAVDGVVVPVLAGN